jgi:uncharacterized protein (DUF1778 family)
MKRGQPDCVCDMTRDARLSVRINPGLKSLSQKAAKKKGITLSTLIEQLLLESLANDSNSLFSGQDNVDLSPPA